MPCTYFDDELNSSSPNNDLVLENQRLRADLIKSNTELHIHSTNAQVRGGIICGILSELEQGMSSEEFTQFLQTVEANSQCDVTSFWLEHKKEDETRLLRDLKNKYSEHELKVIAKLLNKELL